MFELFVGHVSAQDEGVPFARMNPLGNSKGTAMYHRYLQEDTVKKAADMRMFMQYMCVRRNRKEIRRSSVELEDE